MGKRLDYDITVKVLPSSLQTHIATYLSRLETFLEIAVRNASWYSHTALKKV